MKSTILKTTLREIRESLGRYMAILAIVALGVGFFTGLKVTKPAMLKAGGEYLEDNNLYDLRLLSTVGFDEQDVKAINSREGVEIAERIGVYGFSGSGRGRFGKCAAGTFPAVDTEPCGGAGRADAHSAG